MEDTEQESEGQILSVSTLSDASLPMGTDRPRVASEGAAGAEIRGPAGRVDEDWGVSPSAEGQGPAGSVEEHAPRGGSRTDPGVSRETLEVSDTSLKSSVLNVTPAQSVGPLMPALVVDQPAAEASASPAERRQTSEDQMRSLRQENSQLRSQQMELSRSMQEMQRQMLSSSAENVTLKRQLDTLQRGGTEATVTERRRSPPCKASMTERAETAEQEARLAKAQLALLMEKYDRIERDNQTMADEIHRFREQIGRLQQCSSQAPTARSRYITLGLSFLLGLAYFWFYLDELL